MKLIQISIIAIFLYSCGGGAASEDGHHHDHGGGPEGASVVLNPSQMTTLNLTLDSIGQRNLSDVIRLTGSIAVPPQARAEVASPAEGLVQSILVKEGETVSKGQTLVTLSHPSLLQLQQDYLESQSRLKFLEADYQRQKQLSEGNVSAKKILQQAEADYHGARTRTTSLEKQLQLLGISPSSLSETNLVSNVAVKAPIGGTVSHIAISMGSSIQFATPLMNIIDNAEAILEIAVFEQNLSHIKTGQEVSFTLTGTADKTYSARVVNVGSSFENEAKSIKVRADITSDKSGLIDGMNANVFVSQGAQMVPCVQDAALVNYQGVDFIFIYSDAMQHDLLHAGHAHEEEHQYADDHDHEEAHEEEEAEPVAGSIAFLKIPVRKGASAGGYTEITPLQQLPDDARIVVNGAFYVLAAITNQGEAHSH